ncbi:MAG: hypothetical protein GY832_46530 [Chloroflexi bacterium]|nr:hypothetical protein [Chloroflexota bacterium]
MKSTGKNPVKLLREWSGLIITIVAGILALILKNAPRVAVVALVTAFVAAISWWYNVVRKIPKSSVGSTIRLLRKRIPKARTTLLCIVLLRKCFRLFVKWAALLIIIAGTLIWAWFLRQALQPYLEPQFEITALNTLTEDKNAYEVTDSLPDARDVLSSGGVGITFTLQIRPEYSGEKTFGQVVVIVSGSAGQESLERVLWTDLGKDSKTQFVHLTLSEVNLLSGIKGNFDPPHNTLAAADRPFQQAKLIVQIAPKSNTEHPWASQEILIRNAPWHQRSELVWRTNHHEVDLYVKNLGGTGDFTVYSTLVHLDRKVDTNPHPMWNGATRIADGRTPQKMETLEPGEFFTDTLVLSGQLSPGHYLVEIYAIKKQKYVHFLESDISWDNPPAPWWFSRDGNRHYFVIPASEIEVDAAIQAERDRLRDEQDIDLGSPIEPAKEVVSTVGTEGLHQVFEEGEIYAHNDQETYALYGPIFEHYRMLDSDERNKLGFPISSTLAVTSSSGITGTMMWFEGQVEGSSAIYASAKGVAAVKGRIGQSYFADNGGHTGWLGFPLADVQYVKDSDVQMFEYGYIVYHYPCEGGLVSCEQDERDWNRPPVAYTYLASRGTIFDVYADQVWQDTGVHVQQGDRISIVQIDGAWSMFAPNVELHDANGAEGWFDEEAPLPHACLGTLIARVGTGNDHIFRVGRWVEYTSQAEGNLYLAMNDKVIEDNASHLTVQIITSAEE